MLLVEDLWSRYGRIEVLHGINLEVKAGEVVAVVGANGAGKTTLLRCLSGVQPMAAGTITFRGSNITRVPALPPGADTVSRTAPQRQPKCSAWPMVTTPWPRNWRQRGRSPPGRRRCANR